MKVQFLRQIFVYLWIYNYLSTKYCCPKGNWKAYLYKIKKYKKIMNIIKINYIINITKINNITNISKMINLMSIYEIISIRSIFRIYRILNILEILYRSWRSGNPHLLNSFGLID